MASFKDLKGVEIFRVGNWKGDIYKEDDLKQIVENYNKVGFKPPVKCGHSEDKPGLPALGWVENLRIDNGRLLADFSQLYQEVYDAIKDKRYSTVSSEIYFNYKTQDNKVFPKVLKAVAILGQDIPAVKDLKPLHELITASDDTCADKFEIYDMPSIAMPIQVADDKKSYTEWNTKYINDLPDSAFAIIGSGGESQGGKTVPMALRHLPHHGMDGKVDMPHLINALARLDQTDLSPQEMTKARAHLTTHAKEVGMGNYKEFSDEGIRFVIGKVKGEDTPTVQTVLFDKSKWSESQSKSWLKDHDMHSGEPYNPEGGEFIRFRQRDPEDFQNGSFRTINPGVKNQSAASMDAAYRQYHEVIKKEEVREMEVEERIKHLEDQLAKVISYKEGEVKELESKVDELSKELESAKQQAQTFADTDSGKRILQLQKELEDTRVQLDQTARKFAETEKKKATIEEAQRKERVERKTKELKFPALRPYVEVFYEEATKPENVLKVIKFSADTNEPREMSIERVVDGFVTTLNRLADNKYFSEQALIPEFRRDDIPVSDDPREEADKRVRQYMSDHTAVDYSQALKAVLSQDPKLADLYNRS